MTRNEFGFPIADTAARLLAAQDIAAAARERLALAPCPCAACVAAENLPAIQRILAAWPHHQHNN
jgi:hypothetical protein